MDKCIVEYICGHSEERYFPSKFKDKMINRYELQKCESCIVEEENIPPSYGEILYKLYTNKNKP